MDYETVLAQVLALLQQEQRLSYRVLKLRLQLDDETLEALKEDLVYAKQLADANGLKRVLIVSDPMHMRRAVTMASDIGLEAYPSPTPTTSALPA